MSQTGDVSELEELEPLEPIEEVGPEGRPAMQNVTPVMVTGGLPAPAYNPIADREYYRFLFAGVIMFIGCMMPFGPAWEMAGYKTLRGAVFLLIAVGLIWSSWASIHNRRMVKGLLRWVMLAFFPVALGIVDMIVAFRPGTAVAAWVESGGQIKGWGDFFGSLGGILAPGDQVGEFTRYYGSGRLVVFVGAVLAEIFMIMAVFGGAKKIKEQQAERRASTATRKRR